MILTPIVLCSALGAVLVWRGLRASGLALVTLAALVLTALSTGPLPRLILSSLQNQPALTSPDWGADNVIVVIGVGTVRAGSDVVLNHILGYSRVAEAARLFTACRRGAGRRCTLVTSGGDPSGTGQNEAAIMARDLGGFGIAARDVLVEGESPNTFANARLTKRLLGARPIDRVIVVTSGFHARRSLRYFRSMFDHVVAAPSDVITPARGPLPSARTLAFVELAAHEFLGEVYFDVYNFMGWNTPLVR